MCDDNNLFPNVTTVIEEITKVHKEKVHLVENEIKSFKNLLKCVPNNCKTGYQKQKLLQPRRGSLDSPKVKAKPLTLRNSTSPVHSSNCASQSSSSGKAGDENTCPDAGSCNLDILLKRGLSKDLKDCIESVEDYIHARDKPDKRCELERQKHLLRLESMWEDEFKTLQLFDGDLAECLYKYLSVVEKKEPQQKASDMPDSSLSGEISTEEAEQFFEEAQQNITAALCEDLDNIDLEKIKLEGNRSLAIKLNEAVIALSNIRHPITPVFVERKPCHNAFLDLL